MLRVAPVAQLDRASGFEPEGREFESLRARKFSFTWFVIRSPKKGNMKIVKITICLLAFLFMSQCSQTEKKIEPEIIAHRGGKQNWPENTVCAFRQNVAQGIGTIEFDVQVTQDGQIVIYHPDDLSQWTNSSGLISSKTTTEVTDLDAAVKYTGSDTYKTFCNAEDTKIPLLADVLRNFPQTQFVVDMKSPETKLLVDAIVAAIPATDWSRLKFYSTNPEHTKFLRQARPDAVIFEDRNETFARIITSNTSHQCIGQGPERWVGYELVRPLQICDQTKLGSTCLPNVNFTMWNLESLSCTRSMTSGARIVFFGINTVEDYQRASGLDADAVFSDNPSLLIGQKKKY